MPLPRYKIMTFSPCFHVSPKILRRQWTLLKLMSYLKTQLILTPICLFHFKREFMKEMEIAGHATYQFVHEDVWMQLEYFSHPTTSYFKIHSYVLILGGENESIV